MTDVKPRKWRLSIEGIFALVLAVGFVVGACARSADIYWLRHRGEVVTGTVIQEQHGRSSSTVTVRYTTRAGDTLVEDTSNYNHAEIGKPLDVIYDPEQPDRMQAADYPRTYNSLYEYGGLATFLLVLALLDFRLGFLTQLRRFGRRE